MKYLKMFKESVNKKEGYYTKMYDHEYNESGKNFGRIKMSKYNLDYILDLFPGIERRKDFIKNVQYRYKIIKEDIWFYKKPMYGIRQLDPEEGFMFYICEIPDEYFLIYLEIEDEIASYKCDQIDGVKELLKDKGII